MSITAPIPTPSGTDERSVIGPLATVFTPPGECAQPFNINYHLPEDSTASHFAAFFSNCASLRPCLPGLGASTTVPTYGFYSPGLQCPSGWTSFEAPTSQLPATLYPDEEVVLCCPKLYIYSKVQLTPWGTLATDLPRFCAYEVAPTSGDGMKPVQYMSCADWGTSDTSRLNLATSRLLVLAPAIQLNWRPMDALSYHSLQTSSSLQLATPPTSSTSPTTSPPLPPSLITTTIPASTSSSPPSSSPSPAPTQSTTHLTLTAVATTVGVLLTLVLLFFLASHIRRRSHSQSSLSSHYDTELQQGKSELDGSSASERQSDTASIHELLSPREAVELGGCGGVVVELEGSLPGGNLGRRRRSSEVTRGSSTVFGWEGGEMEREGREGRKGSMVTRGSSEVLGLEEEQDVR